jgi:hypothetical protein
LKCQKIGTPITLCRYEPWTPKFEDIWDSQSSLKSRNTILIREHFMYVLIWIFKKINWNVHMSKNWNLEEMILTSAETSLKGASFGQFLESQVLYFWIWVQFAKNIFPKKSNFQNLISLKIRSVKMISKLSLVLCWILYQTCKFGEHSIPT